MSYLRWGCEMKRIFLGLLVCLGLLGAVLLVKGCSSSSVVKDVLIRPNAQGSILEQLEYHKAEIAKYRVAIEKQEALSKKALTERRMGDFRTATNLKKQYTFKLESHVAKMGLLTENNS